MDYELCKKLKEAGFPLKETPHSFAINLAGGAQCDGCDKWDTRPNVPAMCLVEPTLSELIEACGKYVSLWEDNIGWKVIHTPVSPYIEAIEPDTHSELVTGKNPEEAVANLYLALNDSQLPTPK